ncbi:hypothetical protein NEMBOFW57_008688 [Staphylotrichum longicolle]|uniref:CCR4-NOT transcription complex n=1 Tax=Staphylotrichum longicolle TaxID=669026 RepID=A0AAD4ERV5_9PEZI|nr:hypothetical protein NEMBOFW57_008688 [Staphylotrichum longicolle]
MAARKLQQEVDKCFKKVAEGVAEFEAIYEKIEQSTNQAQKEKLEDQLKREIKKLQRLRDQIKTWAASNDIKDKAPLLEQRRLIETQMEKFKAVEKAMKTKAYSKEGLSAAAKLDPKEQAKMDASDFLSSMVDELEQQIEILEAESESIQATMKKGKGHAAKAERIAEIERIIERHKWHQGKLELIRRSLENGGVEPDQVTDLGENIKYYGSDGMNDDFMEDETMYDELNLEDEEDQYGMNVDNDRVSSQDTQSIQDDATPEADTKPPSAPSGKQRSVVDAVAGASEDQRGNSPSVASIQPASQDKAPNVAAASGSGTDRLTNDQGEAKGKAVAQATTDAAESSKGRSEAEEEEESIYHLPASLQDLVESFEVTKKRPAPEPLSIFDDPLYTRIDPDTLFYVFYYKQGTYQYLAARALKDQSWRFHKQYQTWFQRHEEPKSITEFAYKFLEDEV